MKVPRKNIFGHFSIFGLVKCHFELLGLKKQPSEQQNSHLPKTESISKIPQDMERYGPIELGHLCVKGFKISI